MPAGYDPYQQNFQAGGAMGDIGGNIIKILAMFGMGGKGPLKFLQGIMGGGSEEREQGETQVLKSGGPGGGVGPGAQIDLMGQMPPQGPPPMPPTGAPMGPMPGDQQGMPPMPPMGPQTGPQQDQIMQMIMALLQQRGGGQGGPPMGGMMG